MKVNPLLSTLEFGRLSLQTKLSCAQAHNSYEACLQQNTTESVRCDLQEQLEKSASGTGLAFILFTGDWNIQ